MSKITNKLINVDFIRRRSHLPLPDETSYHGRSGCRKCKTDGIPGRFGWIRSEKTAIDLGMIQIQLNSGLYQNGQV